MQRPANSDIRFLIVDDFSTMRRIIRGLLKESGYTNADEAADGKAGLQKLKAGTYDFVISDINMPEMTGFEMLKAIRSDPDLNPLPVVLVTAEARKQDILYAGQLGASGYIIKPFTRPTLEDKIRHVLTRKPIFRADLNEVPPSESFFQLGSLHAGHYIKPDGTVMCAALPAGKKESLTDVGNALISQLRLGSPEVVSFAGTQGIALELPEGRNLPLLFRKRVLAPAA